jgi:hydroxymethylglutaryl-CoA lyase
VVVFTAASETFNKKNINASIKESLMRFDEFLPQAKKDKVLIRGYISTCFGCPYEGEVKEKKVIEVTESLLKMGIKEISIGDTIGVAHPKQVRSLLKKLLKVATAKNLAMHFHDTRGTALANVLESLEGGIRIFDSSSAGLGGCPYAPGASGNLATEDLLYMLHGMGYETGISLEKNVLASHFMETCLGRKLPSRYLQAAK